MDKLKDAAQQALEAIEALEGLSDWEERVLGRLCDKLRAALAEQPAEPVAWVWNPARESWERVRAFGYWQQGAIYAFGPDAPQPKAEQEPVAWLNPYGGVLQQPRTGLERSTYTIPLYTAPQPRREVELTDEEIDEVWNSLIATPDFSRVKIARAVIAAYKEKNK